MRPGTLLQLVCVIAAAGCAQPRVVGESPVYAARMKDAGDRYLGCIGGEAEKEMKNPVAAEDIAAAAHGRCWPQWDAYREASAAAFRHNAVTAQEMQLAHDRTEAHLRQFEREARRSIVESVADRALRAQ